MSDLVRRDERMLRIGHPGAAALVPENTLESLRVALELGLRLVGDPVWVRRLTTSALTRWSRTIPASSRARLPWL